MIAVELVEIYLDFVEVFVAGQKDETNTEACKALINEAYRELEGFMNDIIFAVRARTYSE
jgi:hypothetical protein